MKLARFFVVSILTVGILFSFAPAKTNAQLSVIATIPVGAGPFGMGADSATGRAYVANQNSDTVSVLYGAVPSVLATLSLPPGSGPTAVGVDSLRNRIYVTLRFTNSVAVIDGATQTVVATVGVGSDPQGIAVDSANNRIFVTNSRSSDISVIDGDTYTIRATFPDGNFPIGIAYSAATNRLYMANALDNTVTVMDADTGATLAAVGVGNQPTVVAVDETTNLIYVTNFLDNTVSVLDGATHQPIALIPVGAGPLYGIEINSATKRGYVTHFGGNSVSVLDLNTHTVINTIAVGSGAMGVDLDKVSGRLYVANFNDNTVTVLRESVDTTPPTTTITSAVDGNGAPVANGGSTLSTSITFTFAGTDDVAVASFECSMDGAAFASCTSSKTYINMAVGSHTFQVRAIDTSGNIDPTPASLTWTILTPAEAIQNLINLVKSFNLQQGVENSLDAKLQNAQDALNAVKGGDGVAACNLLGAFVNEIQAQSGNKITVGQANELIAAISQIKLALGCS